jgi:hypothetical protein
MYLCCLSLLKEIEMYTKLENFYMSNIKTDEYFVMLGKKMKTWVILGGHM